MNKNKNVRVSDQSEQLPKNKGAKNRLNENESEKLKKQQQQQKH